MLVGVAWQGRCIPLAWRTYIANSKTDYPSEGQVKVIEGLLQHIKAGLSDMVKVLVLAERGIGTSPDLCRAVDALGWHYLFRVTCQTKIVTAEGDRTIAQQVKPGEIWASSGQIFKQRGRILAHARALWSAAYDEPSTLVTNDEWLTGHKYVPPQLTGTKFPRFEKWRLALGRESPAPTAACRPLTRFARARLRLVVGAR